VAIAEALGMAPHDLLASGSELNLTTSTHTVVPDRVSAPPPPPPAAMVAPAASAVPPPSMSRKGRWFGSRPPVLSEAMDMSMEPADDGDIDELLRLGRDLSPDDLARVIDLARRLQG
jgi:hypothetical protein